MSSGGILKYVSKSQLGIEIGPWFNPIAPKREGFKCLVLDVFDVETLRERARQDPNIPKDAVNRIEDVELLGSSAEIGALSEEYGCAGNVDYIVSSHNIEHIPDPIKFFQGCERTLKPGGVLSMIIPDKRTCFDYFRPISTLGDWLEAYFEHRKKPALKHVFDGFHLASDHNGSGVFSLDVNSSQLNPRNDIRKGYEFWENQIRVGSDEYHDAHCWMLTPAVFELMMLDLAMLGLTHFKVLEISGPNGCSFSVHLEKMDCSWHPDLTEDQYAERRTSLLRKISNELAENAALTQYLRTKVAQTESDIGAPGNATIDMALENELLRKRVRDLEDSTSWKITSPLRRFITLLRSGFSSRQKI